MSYTRNFILNIKTIYAFFARMLKRSAKSPFGQNTTDRCVKIDYTCHGYQWDLKWCMSDINTLILIFIVPQFVCDAEFLRGAKDYPCLADFVKKNNIKHVHIVMRGNMSVKLVQSALSKMPVRLTLWTVAQCLAHSDKHDMWPKSSVVEAKNDDFNLPKMSPNDMTAKFYQIPKGKVVETKRFTPDGVVKEQRYIQRTI